MTLSATASKVRHMYSTSTYGSQISLRFALRSLVIFPDNCVFLVSPQGARVNLKFSEKNHEVQTRKLKISKTLNVVL